MSALTYRALVPSIETPSTRLITQRSQVRILPRYHCDQAKRPRTVSGGRFPFPFASFIQRTQVGEDGPVLLDVLGEFTVESGTVVGSDVFFERLVIPVDLEDEVRAGVSFSGVGVEEKVSRFVAYVSRQRGHHFGDSRLMTGLDGEFCIQRFCHGPNSPCLQIPIWTPEVPRSPPVNQVRRPMAGWHRPGNR